ncbi:protein of unknown function (plasmid) [Azospirillum lipoferum 4B]|uniref:Uncharacterized protein n=1 Tax=Azospirillum lipoferum (strain 4B) TaxID=862719 RepID=G7ZG14_AZOL4|nr:protein of unknown function [Azospirillum lipoferum 4B]
MPRAPDQSMAMKRGKAGAAGGAAIMPAIMQDTGRAGRGAGARSAVAASRPWPSAAKSEWRKSANNRLTASGSSCCTLWEACVRCSTCTVSHRAAAGTAGEAQDVLRQTVDAETVADPSPRPSSSQVGIVRRTGAEALRR